jgi:predicted AlkP superfamily pyrophosphatase or phosphodiesterase
LETCDSVFDVWTRAGVPFRAFGYPLRDHQSLRETADDVRCNPKPLYFLHLYETDAFLHTRCRDLEGFAKALRPYAAGLEEIYRAACQAARTVELSIFSDHGMTPVVGEVDLMGRVEGLGLRMFQDFIALYDSTMARFWFRHPGAEARILGALEGGEKVRLLPEAELRRLGVFFPDRRFGQVIFLMEPGWVINPSHMGSVALAGMHGYHPEEDPWADAMLLSSRAISAETRHIADLFDWMRPGDHGDRAP